MKKNQVFKESEARIIELYGRPYISIDDFDKILSNILFTKCSADPHTLRMVKLLLASIALTYKALKENEQLDMSEDVAIVPLSKKKVKTIVIKSLKLSAKDNNPEGELEELEPYLAPEEPSLCISKEETEELIQDSIQEGLEPYLEVLGELKQIISKAQQTTAKQAKKANKKEPKEKTVIEEIAEEETDEIDYDALAAATE